MIRQTLFILSFATFALLGAQAGSAAEVEQVFKFYCAQCHGLDGDGKGPNVTKDFPVSPRNFTSAAEMNKLTDADLRNVILDGGPALSKSPMKRSKRSQLFPLCSRKSRCWDESGSVFSASRRLW